MTPGPTAPPGPSRGAAALRLALLGALLALFAVGVLTGVTPGVDEIRAWVEGAGPAAPFAFVAVCAAGSVVLVPKPVLSVLGGVLFGPVVGALVVVPGVTAGAWAGFALARRLGGDVVHPTRGRVDDVLLRHGFVAVVCLRFLPVVPFGLVNYAAGVTGVRVVSFVAGTAVGVVPATLVYTTAGASLGDLTVGQWALAAAAVALPALVGAAVWRRGALRR